MIEPIVDNSASAQASYEFGLILQNIGEIQRQQGQSDEAIKNVQRSLAIESRLAGENSNSLDALISMAKGHALLGQMLIEQPDGLEPALVDYQEAVSLQEKVVASTQNGPTRLSCWRPSSASYARFSRWPESLIQPSPVLKRPWRCWNASTSNIRASSITKLAFPVLIT